ncbi:hypothetical protein [Mycolicibacterium helvum]|uniref:Uncharacterized protein n=1 Tax=Mycolicibacterium helvum TaxID=1534349 RepID=A0A7I7TGC1_9MYCO|nr:hypothetical protein [Mycolicibacterium helvum]BBY67753.1 hypothetical protein MHEL_59960 [Mycolicibacterium helvum]
MTIAAFILGLLGFGVAVSSLTWQVYTFLMQGARPKLTPVVGYHYGGGLLTNDASRDVRESLRTSISQFPQGGQFVVGVNIVNAGRAPFHVAKWALRADPARTSFVSVDDPLGCPSVPHDIAPGAEATFFTGVVNIRALSAASGVIDPRRQRIIATVESGGRTYTSKPIASANLAIGSA